MKITQAQLRRIIREEIERTQLEEGVWDDVKGLFGGKKSKESAEESPSTLTKEKSAMKFLDMYIKEYKKQTLSREGGDIFMQSARDFGANGRFSFLTGIEGGSKVLQDMNRKIISYVRQRIDKANEIAEGLEAIKKLLTSEAGAKEVTGPGGVKGEFNPYGKMPFESRRRRGSRV